MNAFKAHDGQTSSFQATAAVLNITELIEGILIHVDLKTLLLAQRVSQKWNSVINKSIHIQRRLFMAPAPVEEVWLYSSHDYPFIDPAGVANSGKTDVDGMDVVLPAELNRFLTKCHPENFQEEYAKFGSRCKISDKNASWRRMLAVQPPCRDVILLLCCGKTMDSEGEEKDADYYGSYCQCTASFRSAPDHRVVGCLTLGEIAEACSNALEDGEVLKLYDCMFVFGGIVFPTKEERIAVQELTKQLKAEREKRDAAPTS